MISIFQVNLGYLKPWTSFSQVRAEKRACFKRLPRILAFNTMRYTFNFHSMAKEKVNTLFEFPTTLDMSPYMEDNLIPQRDKEDVQGKKDEKKTKQPSLKYELIGVTVHTGTADGGHYYAFIRDRGDGGRGGVNVGGIRDRWYSFNDAEVKPFDPSQIGPECFGGETPTRQYDQVRLQ